MVVRLVRGAAGLALAAGGVAVGQVLAARGRAPAPPGEDRWHTVTVAVPPDRVAPGGALPERLAAFGDRIEVQVRPAPGDRGTEIAARLRGPVPSGAAEVVARASGDDPRQELRTALRDTRSLLETGDVLRPSGPPTTRPTPTNAWLRLLTSRARGEGTL